MLKRIRIYLKEMYPVIPRLFVGFVLFFEIYFLVLLTNDRTDVKIGAGEFVGGFTVFAFLLTLRISDEFKDREADKTLFPERPYPSGRVKTKDLIVLLVTAAVAAAVLNIVFMNNLLFFGILAGYAVLMGVWFFSRHKIQKNLFLALITHNPVQLVLNAYMISYTCYKYDLPLFTFNNAVIAFTLYFPGLVWEITRKIRAPQDETEYVTYSKLWGYKKAVRFVLFVMFLDVLTSSYLIYQLFPIAVATVIASYLWLVRQGAAFMKNPSAFKIVKKFEIYEYITESTVIVLEALYLFLRWK